MTWLWNDPVQLFNEYARMTPLQTSCIFLPWVTRDISSLMRKRDKLLKNRKKSTDATMILKTEYYEQRRLVFLMIKTNEDVFFADLSGLPMSELKHQLQLYHRPPI